jgi:predicted acylesterase/phospholipase RssA
MALSTRVKYFVPVEVTGGRLYKALRAIAAAFGGNANDALDATLRVDGGDFSIQRVSNSEDVLHNFSLNGRLEGQAGPITFTLTKQEQSLTLKVQGVTDATVREFGRQLVEQLTLRDATAIGLSLSGGGFRATLFHLGVIRFLRDAELLPYLTHVFAVSGGSIMAAHLALHWPQYLGDETEFADAAAELIAFARQDVRGRIIRRWLLGGYVSWLYAARCRLNRIALLQASYARLFRKPADASRPAELADLANRWSSPKVPSTPEVYILATAMKRGDLCAFDNTGFSYHASPPLQDPEQFSDNTLKVAAAVAASSAFPPLFPPLSTRRLGLVGQQDNTLADDYLSDGGVFDNLGTRRFLWMREQVNHELKYFFVSDAGAPFDWEGGTFNGILARTTRATGILMRRVGDLEFESASRRDELFSTKLIRCDLTRAVLAPDITEQTPGDQQVQKLVGRIRTDLDEFSPTEIRALVWHGYLVAREAFGSVVTPEERTALRSKTSTLWDPTPQEPNADVTRTRAILTKSCRHTIGWRRWLTDWATWMLLGIPLTAAAVLFLTGFVLHRNEQIEARGAEARLASSTRAALFALELKGESPVADTDRHYRVVIRYLSDEEIKKQPRYQSIQSQDPYLAAARLQRLSEVVGKKTKPATARVSVRENLVPPRWSGVIDRLVLPNGVPLQLTFGGKVENDNRVTLQVVQTPIGKAGSANGYQVTLQPQPDGTYRGDLPDPELDLKIGEVSFALIGP